MQVCQGRRRCHSDGVLEAEEAGEGHDEEEDGGRGAHGDEGLCWTGGGYVSLRTWGGRGRRRGKDT